MSKASLPEVIDLLNSWRSNSLPIKVSVFSTNPRIVLVLRGDAWPAEEVDALCVGVEGVAQLIISLTGAVFDLEDSTEAPEDLREEAMGRSVRCLTCTLPTGMLVYLYELWAVQENNNGIRTK